MSGADSVSKIMVRRAGKPSLPPEQAERVRLAIKLLLKQRYAGNRTELGRAIDRSQPAVTQLLSGDNRPSYETAQRVAKLLGVKTEQLLEGGATPAPARDVYPNLERALKRLNGLLDVDVIEMLRGMRLPHGAADRTEWQWIESAVEVARLQKLGLFAPSAE